MSSTHIAPSTSTVSTFERLVFWSIGYGGWMGIGMLPIILSITHSQKVRAILMFLSAPMGALFMISLFSTVYLFTSFMREVFAIMSSPLFLHSCCSLMSLGGVVFAFGVALCDMIYGRDHKVMSENNEVTSDESSDESQSDEGESQSDEGESEESSDENASENSDVELNYLVEELSKKGIDFENVGSTGKPTDADTTLLRNAPPLPNDEDEDVEKTS